jgi:hypothetical protein
MNGGDLESGMKSRRPRAQRDPDAIRQGYVDERRPIVCVLADPPPHRRQAHLLSLLVRNGLASITQRACHRLRAVGTR